MKNPYATIFILLIIAAVIYFLLKTQIEALFMRLKTGTVQPADPAATTQTTANNAPSTETQIPANNTGANLSCSIKDINFSKSLSKGMPANKEVEYLQCYLNAVKNANLTVDGVYGSKTEKALAAHMKVALPMPPTNLLYVQAMK